jgi:hypothetical protein
MGKAEARRIFPEANREIAAPLRQAEIHLSLSSDSRSRISLGVAEAEVAGRVGRLSATNGLRP